MGTKQRDKEIVAAHVAGESVSDLAKRHGISKGQIYVIVNRSVNPPVDMAEANRCGLSVRAFNCLKYAGLRPLEPEAKERALLSLANGEMAKTKNCGRKTLDEIWIWAKTR